jgi:hypothetical protein
MQGSKKRNVSPVLNRDAGSKSPSITLPSLFHGENPVLAPSTTPMALHKESFKERRATLDQRSLRM